ncbi:MAG: serine/threonine protein kinase [Polaribacter sp.]|jgi:serine/threonine protein kinase
MASSKHQSAKNANQALSVEQKRAALTQISHIAHSDKKSHGFMKAKEDADQALAENKIILNKRFVLESTLGAGGMGTVYKAQDLRKVEARDNNPYVAAKILNADFKNHPDAFITLQREASRSHLLSHPNIVTVHDFDRDGDTIFMTMELMKGQDLDQLLKTKEGIGLGKEKALSILTDFCEALKHAHKKGIIHSDFKPGNIFITEDGAKVLDFGIARLALESKLKDHFDSSVLGAITPGYASLEMIQRKEPDASDDVYAAAVITYEMLTGHHPFNHLSAAAALAKKLSPAPIEGLTKRQWQTLESALSFRRGERTKSIDEFLVGMTFVPKTPVFTIVSFILLPVLVWFVYSKYFSPNELTTAINESFSKAISCYQLNNYQCAITSSRSILNMSPDHIEAKKLLGLSLKEDLKEKINQYMYEIERCLKTNDLSNDNILCAKQQLEKLSLISKDSPFFSDAELFISKKEKELLFSQSMQKAKDCFYLEDYQCAGTNTQLALSVSPNDISALILLGSSQKALDEQHIKLENQESLYSTSISKSKNCYKKQQFNCAIKYANQALIAKPEDIKAKDVKEDAEDSQKLYQQNLTRANKILNDGHACFKALNYSCAIAKSESALEFLPELKAAKLLKRDAKNAMENIKKSIEFN